MESGLKTWVGECSAWECDDLGHLNMRHYMTKTYQARQMMIIHLGLGHVFKAKSDSTVWIRDYHIKYHGEARPGNSLFIETGVLSFTEDTLTLCHMMYHVDRRIAASIVETIEHISQHTRQTFKWPSRVYNALANYQVEIPTPAKPRGFSPDLNSVAPTEADLKRWHANPIGVGVFQPGEIGHHGHVTAQAFLGRTTETIAHFKDGYPELHDVKAREAGLSGAMLEARAFIHARPQAGDGYRFYSGIQSGNRYTRNLVHHMVDAQTGSCLFSMLGVGCIFDLNSRRLVKATEAQVATLETLALKDLKL